MFELFLRNQAARRLRLPPDDFDERERLVAVETDFLRFGRICTTGAAGDCGSVTGRAARPSDDASCWAVTMPCELLFACPKPPKASFNIAPYHVPYKSITASVARSHGKGAGVEAFVSAIDALIPSLERRSSCTSRVFIGNPFKRKVALAELPLPDLCRWSAMILLGCAGGSRRADVTDADVAQVETGKRKNPALDVLKRLARALGVPVTELLQ